MSEMRAYVSSPHSQLQGRAGSNPVPGKIPAKLRSGSATLSGGNLGGRGLEPLTSRM